MFEVLGQRGQSLWLPLGSKLTIWWPPTISLFVFVCSDNPFFRDSCLFWLLFQLFSLSCLCYIFFRASFSVSGGEVEEKGKQNNDVAAQPQPFSLSAFHKLCTELHISKQRNISMENRSKVAKKSHN